MADQKECAECGRLKTNMDAANRMGVHVTGGNDAFKKAVAEYEAHRTAAHPESIDERLAG